MSASFPACLMPKHYLRVALVSAAALSLSACGVNSVPTAEENAKAKWADVESAYQRRADLVPNLVATAQGAAKSETQILTNVTNARAAATSINIRTEDLSDPATFNKFQNAQNQLTQALDPRRKGHLALRFRPAQATSGQPPYRFSRRMCHEAL